MQVIGEAQAPPTKEELIKLLSPSLKTLTDNDIEGDVEPEKVVQYQNARRNTLMYRGLQFLAPVMRDGGYSDFQQVSGINSGETDGNQSFDYTQNIFRGSGRKFIAVMGSRAPNVTARADDPEDDDSVRSTRSANEANAILDSWWDVDERNNEAALYVYKTGPAFIYTPWNADAQLYGEREEPNMLAQAQPMGDSQYHCMNCGADSPEQGQCPTCQSPLGPQDQQDQQSVDVPIQDKKNPTTKYPNGQVECYITDCTTTTTPFYTTRLKTCQWLKHELEKEKSSIIAKHPELRGKNMDNGGDDGGSTASSDQGRMARDAAITPTGGPTRRNNSRWLYTRLWIHPDMYALVKEDDKMQLLKDNYPTGLKITKVNGKTVDLDEEKLSEVWAVIKPEAGETINIDPIGQDLISPQILKNHMLNIGAETLERGVAQTLADPRVFNFQQWKNRRAAPAEIIPALPAVGDSLAESFYQLPTGTFSEQMEPWVRGVESDGNTVIGITPQIFGGGDPANTAREAEIRKNAAMMQLSTTWTYFRKGWSEAKKNGVLQLVKYGSGIIRGGSRALDLAELTSTGWHFEADEAIPATWGQRRDLLMFMMEKPPNILQAFGYTSPHNIQESAQLLGMPSGWYTPGVDDAEKARDVIQKLLQAAPIQKQNPDGSTDIQPSIPADQFEDNHALMAQYVQEWAQKQAAPGGIRETNPNGYANVIAWGTKHQTLANPPAPPPPPVVPKISVAVSSKDLAPNQTQAILADANLQVPPPPAPLPQGIQTPNAGPGAPQGPPPAAAVPGQTIQ